MPEFAILLAEGDSEPVVDLKQLLTSVCTQTAIESTIDYALQPQPALTATDFEWVQLLLKNTDTAK